MVTTLLMASQVVFLSCVVGENHTKINLGVDESRGVVSYEVVNTGHSREVPTVFGATRIVGDLGRSGDKMVVDRQTLRYSEIKEALGKVFVLREGTCSVVENAERKF